MDLRELWRVCDGLDGAGVDGEDGDDYTGEEEWGQLVDVLDTHKDHQGHQAEAERPVDPHVVQHGAVPAVGAGGVEYGCLGEKVFLEQKNKNVTKNTKLNKKGGGVVINYLE